MKFMELDVRDSRAVDAAAEHLELGGLLAHPTGGVYGLGGAREEGTELELARLKNRSPDMGFVYLVAGLTELRDAFPVLEWNPLAERFAVNLWPGPLTLVLQDGSPMGVAVRVEPHPVTRAVLGRYGGALSSTSLNVSGQPAAVRPESARRVLEEMPSSDRSVLLLDAGVLSGPPPSTLVKVPGGNGESWELIREGAIPAARLEALASRPGDEDTTTGR